MNAMWCLFGLIVLAGALGGFIFTLHSPISHRFRVPFKADEIDSGFLGHVIIGVGGAFVAIGAAVPVFDLNLSIFENTWDVNNTPKGLIPISLYVLSIGVIGGFSGLRIISGLSDAMLKKLREEIANTQHYAEKEIKDLRSSVAKNYAEDRKREIELKEAKIHSLLLEGNFLIFSGAPDEGIEKIELYLEEKPENAKAWCWLAMGYKRDGKIDEAIRSIRQAIKIDSTNWVYHFNLACYHSIARKDLNLIEKSLQDALSAADTIDEKSEIVEILTKDSDFESIKGQDGFELMLNNLRSKVT